MRATHTNTHKHTPTMFNNDSKGIIHIVLKHFKDSCHFNFKKLEGCHFLAFFSYNLVPSAQPSIHHMIESQTLRSTSSQSTGDVLVAFSPYCTFCKEWRLSFSHTFLSLFQRSPSSVFSSYIAVWSKEPIDWMSVFELMVS